MKLNHPFWQNSQCLKHYLHRFEVAREYETGVLEVCKICHVKKFFKITDTGKIDNNKFMSYHLRQVLGNIPIPNYIWHEYQYDPLSNEQISPYV